jgi:hypothetical protein
MSEQGATALKPCAKPPGFGQFVQSWRESAWSAVLPILLPMIVTNFLMCSALPLFVIGIGFVPVQVALLTVLLVLGPGPLWRRWLWHWGWAGALYGSWSAGYYLWRPRDAVETIDELTFGLPLFALIVQLPFWVARVLMGWRFVRHEGGDPAPGSMSKGRPEQLTVRDLLQAMAILAVSLGIARLATDGGHSRGQPGLDWFGMLMGSTMVMVVASFAVLPILWIFSYETQLESCWGFTGLYALLWIVGIVFLVQNDPPIAVTLVLMVICFAVVFSAGLSRLRMNGFQILRGRG